MFLNQNECSFVKLIYNSLFNNLDINHRFSERVIYLYKLSKDEENLLKLIIKHARIDYFRNNNLYYDTEDIDNIEIASKSELEKEVIDKYDKEIQIEKFENFFTEENIFRITKELTYNEKLVLFLYYVEGKNDREIGEILSQKTNTIYMKRFRIIEKIKKKMKKRGQLNV